MHTIIVKPSPEKRDPKRPASYPEYNRALRKGKERAAKLKFESEGQKKDYEKLVKNNENNVYGLPAFFPAIPIREYVTTSNQELTDKDRVYWFLLSRIRYTDLWCWWCDKVTEHSVEKGNNFCTKCGKQFRVVAP